MQLEIEYTNGEKQTITSDESWKWYTENPESTKKISRKHKNAHEDLAGWNYANFDDSNWPNVDVLTQMNKTPKSICNENISIVGSFECSIKTINKSIRNAIKDIQCGSHNKEYESPWLVDMSILCNKNDSVNANAIEKTYELFCFYGDTTFIKNTYQSFKEWLLFNQDSLILNDYFFNLFSLKPDTTIAKGLCTKAYFFHLNTIMKNIAKILDYRSDFAMFSMRCNDLINDFNHAYYNLAKHEYNGNNVVSNTLALYFGLVPPGEKSYIVKSVAKQVKKEIQNPELYKCLIIIYIYNSLFEANISDLAYKLAIKTDDNDWKFRYLAGISPHPEHAGFKEFLLKPNIENNVSYVKSDYNSVHGLIISEWKVKTDTFYYNISIPVNTTATVAIPALTEQLVTENGSPAALVRGISFIKFENGYAFYHVESGDYNFKSNIFRK